MHGLLLKGPWSIIIIWTALTLFIYLFFIDKHEISHHTIHNEKLHDAIVFITMGSMAQSRMIDMSIASVRKTGRWKGDIYLLTDTSECFTDSINQYRLQIIQVPSVNNILDIKTMKTQLFHYLPSTISSILYIDSDILITRSLDTFFHDVYIAALKKSHTNTYPHKPSLSSSSSSLFLYKNNLNNNNNNNLTSSNLIKEENEVIKQLLLFDIGLFLDARGHFVGFCSGCDRWHTGVLWLTRETSTSCLTSWEQILRDGRYDTDQEAMDAAEREEGCTRLLALPGRHLLFAKDYLALLLTGGRTFLHMTAIGRLQNETSFYRDLIAPWLISGVLEQLNSKTLSQQIYKKKQCSLFSSSSSSSFSSSSVSSTTAVMTE